MRLNAGHRFRDYEIIELIGAGGMGEVYLAKELLVNRLVAIKRLNPSFAHNNHFATRFRNEAQILAQLSHPNILRVINLVREDDEFLMVLEYTSGITLKDLIQSSAPIHEKRSIHIFNQIASALAYAHSKGIVHRDVKPSNIMIDVENGDLVKVMDFGIARFLNDTNLTKTGLAVGTVTYMSPEQILKPRDVDQRSDIYSAGIVLYEMISGSLPYDFSMQEDSDFVIQQLIVNQPIPDPRIVNSNISETTASYLMAITRKNPDDRPQSISLMTHASRISPSYRDTPTKITQDTNIAENYQEEYNNGRSKVWIGIAAGILLVISIAVVYSLSIPGRQNDRRVPYSEENATIPDATHLEAETQSMIDPKLTHIDGGSITISGVNMHLSDFEIGIYEISRAEYQHYMKLPTLGEDKLPVVDISWMQAIEFCNRLSLAKGLDACYSYSDNGKNPDDWPASRFQPNGHVSVTCDWTKNGYRLPTELEWIYAANGAHEQIIYSYSGSEDIEYVAWFARNTDSLQRCGMKAPNRLGVHDMTGNASEWVWDIAGDYPGSDILSNYRGASTGRMRIVKGGSMQDQPEWCNIKQRGTYYPERTSHTLGFRVARYAKISS